MEQTIPTQAIHVYQAKTRFDLTQVYHGDALTFPVEVDLGLSQSIALTCLIRGVTLMEGKRLEYSQKLHELLDGAELLIEQVGDDAEVIDGVECDVWFKPPGAPQFLSLANSLVNIGVAESK